MPKYELTANFMTYNGRKLFQIKALVSFGLVKAGDLGGYIETEENLSQTGNAWVFDNAKVYGDARVCGDARVYDNAWVCDNADWLNVGPIGSRSDFTTFFRCKDDEIRVACGCFVGTLLEFRAKVIATHGNNKHAKMYNLVADMAELQIKGDDSRVRK